ncbi:hypothetical protein AB3S75_007675 [Citrus x aurantiifolia]
MLNLQFHNQSQSIRTLSPLPKPFLHGNGPAFRPAQLRPSFKKAPKIGVGFSPSSNSIKAIFNLTAEKSTKVKAVITVKPIVSDPLAVEKLIGTLVLELVSAELDPETGKEKPTIKSRAHRSLLTDDDGNLKYKTEFDVPSNFGEVGAILVEADQLTETYLKDIVLDGLRNGPVNIACDSWIQPKIVDKQKRIFFTNKSYLPSQTPNGLTRLRGEELNNLQGDGQGERKIHERIYDYDVYNDLGMPDSILKSDLGRPVLGGKEHPYPRRCRTGHPKSSKDPASESWSLSVYVPRDEAFSLLKTAQFSATGVYSALHAVIPFVESILRIGKDKGFPSLEAIDKLFNEGVELPPEIEKLPSWLKILPNFFKSIANTGKDILRFETPETLKRDKLFWLRDEEFGRETLAGLNPYGISAVADWPLKSTLDAETYGPTESAITKELIEKEIGGSMTVEEAIKQKKLFIIDYHDALLPYVEKVRQIKDTTLYGSRTVFFLNPDGTLRPLAIELTRPPMDGKPQWKQVFTPSTGNSTESWLWRLAKAHVLAHDSGYHQLISHWLRTHCCVEPCVIATNRRLSAMHPINRLLKPHFRYTMEINALARKVLINADGIFETNFFPGKYCMEFSSVIYDKHWRFDNEGLPKDLIRRGIAVEDPKAPHGLKLNIEDYPYANDGLDLWDALKQWVANYVNHYYPDPSLVESDEELQAWWTEIRTVGHADKKDEPWWPVLKTPQDLIEIITTIAWVASGHHAAVNFGQYLYGGYFPNRPTVARTNMPNEDQTKEEWKSFLEKPEAALLRCFPAQFQALTVMLVIDLLSTHSPDEEYLGKEMEPAWGDDPVIKAAFEEFNLKMQELERIIDDRNSNENLKNRTGAAIVPYELLKPFSEAGATGKGVPYSISI